MAAGQISGGAPERWFRPSKVKAAIASEHDRPISSDCKGFTGFWQLFCLARPGRGGGMRAAAKVEMEPGFMVGCNTCAENFSGARQGADPDRPHRQTTAGRGTQQIAIWRRRQVREETVF